jgi:hypothetical protein
MTRADHQILFMALGFVAVILQETPHQNQAIRAVGIAKLIEEFCRTSLPEIFEIIDSEENQSGDSHAQT